MAFPSMLLSKRRLADQRPASLRKKRKAHVPLSKAFLRKDYSFPPPVSQREPERGSPTRLRVRNSSVCRNTHGLDPFKYLGDDEIYIIISNLSAKDTETLRRVSQLWKATSEYHCSQSILTLKLPWASTQSLVELSKSDTNLRYRRHLFNYCSLQLGLATRAFKFYGVYDWHMNRTSIVWCDGTDRVSIRTLRARNGTPIASEDEAFELDETTKAYFETPYVLLSKTGDLILLHRSYIPDADGLETVMDPSRHRCPKSIDRLVKITSQGQRWQLDLNGSICKPAIGENALYFVEARPQGQFNDDYGPAFKKVDLMTGTILYSTFPPEINETGVFIRYDRDGNVLTPGKLLMPTGGRSIQVATLDTSLKLAGKEEIAIWSDHNQRIHIFSTANGQILFTYNRLKMSALVVSTVKPQLWDISYRRSTYGIDSVRYASYEGRTETLSYAFTRGERSFGRGHGVASYTLDADRPIAFARCHSMDVVDDKTRDPFTTIEIVGLEKIVSGETILLGDIVRPLKEREEEDYDDGDDDRALITLPPLPGQGPKRRVLEIETPWNDNGNDFFGIIEGYLVYHNFIDKELTVVDFWPNW